MDIADYLDAIRKVHATGVARSGWEHKDIVRPAGY